MWSNVDNTLHQELDKTAILLSTDYWRPVAKFVTRPAP